MLETPLFTRTASLGPVGMTYGPRVISSTFLTLFMGEPHMKPFRAITRGCGPYGTGFVTVPWRKGTDQRTN